MQMLYTWVIYISKHKKKQLLIYWIWNAFSYFNNFSFKTCQKSCPSPGVAWCRDSGVLLLCCLSGSADGSGELQQIQQQLLQVSLLKGRHHHIYCFFFCCFFLNFSILLACLSVLFQGLFGTVLSEQCHQYLCRLCCILSAGIHGSGP